MLLNFILRVLESHLIQIWCCNCKCLLYIVILGHQILLLVCSINYIHIIMRFVAVNVILH